MLRLFLTSLTNKVGKYIIIAYIIIAYYAG